MAARPKTSQKRVYGEGPTTGEIFHSYFQFKLGSDFAEFCELLKCLVAPYAGIAAERIAWQYIRILMYAVEQRKVAAVLSLVRQHALCESVHRGTLCEVATCDRCGIHGLRRLFEGITKNVITVNPKVVEQWGLTPENK